LTNLFSSGIIIENLVMKVINMNAFLVNTSKYFFSFSFSVVFYFGYAYFASKKLLLSLQSSF
jgi:hypothetical protein